LDEHQDHFVVDTTIIKVRSVNEATDRTVSLPVPTAMTASDMVSGAYASLAYLNASLPVISQPVCTANPIRIYRMIESAKLAR
jgi:hypothetical protein